MQASAKIKKIYAHNSPFPETSALAYGHHHLHRRSFFRLDVGGDSIFPKPNRIKAHSRGPYPAPVRGLYVCTDSTSAAAAGAVVSVCGVRFCNKQHSIRIRSYYCCCCCCGGLGALAAPERFAPPVPPPPYKAEKSEMPIRLCVNNTIDRGPIDAQRRMRVFRSSFFSNSIPLRLPDPTVRSPCSTPIRSLVYARARWNEIALLALFSAGYICYAMYYHAVLQ